MKEDDLDEAIAQMVRDGEMEVVQDIPETKFRLTEKGKKRAREMIRSSGLNERDFFASIGLPLPDRREGV